MNRIVILALLLSLSGCDKYLAQPPSDNLSMSQAKEAAIKEPIGRFVVAGKREFSNGSEIYVLDTVTGQVCYYFASSGQGVKPLESFNNCVGTPHFPRHSPITPLFYP